MSLPNEMWMCVFEHVESPSDLASVVRTSSWFKVLAIKILYRNLVWSDPLKFVKNHSFLLQNTHLCPLIHALTLGVSTAVLYHSVEQISRARAVVHISGDITSIQRSTRTHETRILDEAGITTPIEYLASNDVTVAMYNQINSFTNLLELTFNNMVLPDSFYELIHHFPILDKLVIVNCTPPLRAIRTSFHPRTLPITQLTILSVRGPRDQRELRAFGEAQRLRVLRFDWTCYIFKHFLGQSVAPPNNWQHGLVVLLPLPPGLATVEALQTHAQAQATNSPQLQSIPISGHPLPSPHIRTIDVRFPTQKSWQSFVAEPHDHLVSPFTEFLEKCPDLANLRIRNYIPWLRLPDSALPKLAYYQGPLTTIKSVVSGSRRLKHLTMRDPGGGLPALEKAFKEIDAVGANLELETLSVFIGSWDNEILYAILHHFGALKRLEIVYKEGDPSEEMILGMGAHFFGDMPHLWSVRVFRVFNPALENLNAIAGNAAERGYSHRSVQLALDELVSAESSGRADLDDPDFDEARFATSSSYAGRAMCMEEEQEDVEMKELICAWNRYCPALREVQLKAGHVWRRSGPNDVWVRRATKVSRLISTGFEEV